MGARRRTSGSVRARAQQDRYHAPFFSDRLGAARECPRIAEAPLHHDPNATLYLTNSAALLRQKKSEVRDSGEFRRVYELPSTCQVLCTRE